MNLEFASPHWLWLLIGIPLLFYLLRRQSSRNALPYPGTTEIRAGRWSSFVAMLPDILRALTMAALIVAIARPRSPGATVEDDTRGVPIVVALDISSSMLAEDFRPRNRLTVAKQNVARFIEARESDPIGIVAFAAEAVTLVPITSYDGVLLRSLQSLDVGLLEDGTAIGEGLAIAVNRLRATPGSSRVVILMSDGESNRGDIDPVEAARAAATFGIQVHTIGVGSEGVSRIPVAREGGGIRYAELPVGLDETLLREIASITGGTYFRATDPRALAAVYARIDEMVKTPIEVTRRVEYREWYLPILLLAGLILGTEWLVRGSRWGVVPA